MLSLFSFELTRTSSALLAAAALAAVAIPQAQAAGVPGQGTWETTLQGRDLDASKAGFEAYYDTVLNITWLADANSASGLLNWNAANSWAASLNINGVSNWRLPDVKPVNGSSFQKVFSYAGTTDYAYNITSTQSELSHLFYVTLGNKGTYDTSGNNNPSFGLSNTGPFGNVQSYLYWSGMETAPSSEKAWDFSTTFGFQGFSLLNTEKFAWAVHPGDVASVPELSTYALMGLGLAAVLVARRRRV